MDSLDKIQKLKEELHLLSIELEEEVKKNNKSYRAIKEIFPLELYKTLRPDVREAMSDNCDEIINHFVDKGIDEINIKEKIADDNWSTAKQIAKNILIDCRPKIKIIENTMQKRPLILSKTFGNYLELNNNQSHIFAQNHTITHLESNSVCTWIPKNACSSLRFSFAKANGAIRTKDDIQWIHRNNQCYNADNKDLLRADYTFVILRDPFERILSYFLDKICHQNGDSEYDKSYSHAKLVFNTTETTTFQSFIEAVYLNPRSILDDIHTTPQCNFLIYENYDDYFSLETIEEAKAKILMKTGVPLEDTRAYNNIYTTKDLQSSNSINPKTPIDQIYWYLERGFKPESHNMFTNDMIKKILPLYLGDVILYESVIGQGRQRMNKWVSNAI